MNDRDFEGGGRAAAPAGSDAPNPAAPNGVPPCDRERDPGTKARIGEQIRRERRAVLLVNSRSRRGKRFYRDTKRLLESRGISLDPKYSSLQTRNLSRVIADAIADGHRLIVIGGGDGTIASMLHHFVYCDAVLAILPLGTANSFARTLGIPLDLEPAVDVIVSGKVVDVDLGRIGQHYFSTVASVGLAARIARNMPVRLKKWLGRFAYPVVALAQLRRFGAFRCTVVANGRSTTVDALEVRIANGAYQGGVAVVQEASTESRDLVAHITTGRDVGKLLKVWLRLTAGVGVSSRDVQSVRSERFVVDAAPRQYVSVDGEAFIQTPFEACVAKQALLVMVPKDTRELE